MNDDNKIILIASLIAFATVFTLESVPIALPTMTAELNISPVLANWISIAGLLLCVSLELPCGKILPKYGVVKLSKIGSIVLIIGILLSVLTNNPYIIIAGRLIDGFAIGILAISITLLVSYQIPENRLGRAFGILGVFSAVSTLLSPLLGGMLISYASWQLLFAFPLPLLLILLCLLFSFSKDWHYEKGDVNISGFVLFIISMVLVIYGLSFLNTFDGVISLVIGIFLLIAFIYYEVKSSNPIYDFALLKNRKYVINNYGANIHRFAKSGITIVLVMYLQNVRGLSASITGAYIAIIALMIMFFSPLSGHLSDRYDSMFLSRIGLIIMTVSSVLFCFISELGDVAIIVLLIILGIGIGVFESPNKKVVVSSVEPSKLGYAASFLSTMRDSGDILGVTLFTLVIGVFSGVSAYWTLCSQITLVIITLLLVSAIVLFYYDKAVSS